MNAYLDTSALVKLVIAEPESEAIMHSLLGAEVYTGRVTYAECRSAIARREREKPQFGESWVQSRTHLDAHWANLQIIEVTQRLVIQAGDFADAFGLRGYDAIQLAAGYLTWTTVGEDLTFWSYDRPLNRAARLLGLKLPEHALL